MLRHKGNAKQVVDGGMVARLTVVMELDIAVMLIVTEMWTDDTVGTERFLEDLLAKLRRELHKLVKPV